MATDPENAARRAAFERLFQHGGDIESGALAFPDAPRPWLDLSTGINPISYPLPTLPADVWARLPDPVALHALQSIAGQRYGVAADCVVAAPGAEALIQALPRLISARAVAIVGPTYSEHERAWRAAGAAVDVVPDVSALGDQQVVVVVNPNNPDGRLYSRRDLISRAELLASRDALMIVDEAFMDLEDASVAADSRRSMIVLRSFGKVYGLAGLRLGFALAAPDRASFLRRALGPWPVSGPAIEIGRRALADEDWLDATRRRLREDVAWLDAALTGVGFEIVGGALLFRLARHPWAATVFEVLCARGVLTRPFRQRPDWLRFGTPCREQRERLREALNAARRVLSTRPPPL